jgi:hypothetical protein
MHRSARSVKNPWPVPGCSIGQRTPESRIDSGRQVRRLTIRRVAYVPKDSSITSRRWDSLPLTSA